MLWSKLDSNRGRVFCLMCNWRMLFSRTKWPVSYMFSNKLPLRLLVSKTHLIQEISSSRKGLVSERPAGCRPLSPGVTCSKSDLSQWSCFFLTTDKSVCLKQRHQRSWQTQISPTQTKESCDFRQKDQAVMWPPTEGLRSHVTSPHKPMGPVTKGSIYSSYFQAKCWPADPQQC